mmetsp:Transcript_22636/g.58974  ORF Transcript_22636/g.58974 Transcript_22636/m.58974 type:complete len:240 (+) Transcript_22636:196-915(+)|eukprot:CAMPEP_0119526852 /NCGR_PEP_ID=MMETSP1344-20130328/41386_1 /TAXON_ID=236787 /ORGANISM="Florenciella parvula, Strain CCMP2471" /LENGTH=239 /DNA_ID=CAMNT_0007565939 /DNA_START=147 /DNA_END=866 /DNA_ORIENTATION=+
MAASVSQAAKATAEKLWCQNTSKIVAIGRNYVAHAHELNNAVPANKAAGGKPFWFLKPPSSLIGSGSPHECAPGRTESHHELELGLVIGERCRRVSEADAMGYISGYFLALDMTDREGQNAAKEARKPWTACKGWDTSCPVSDMVPVSEGLDPTKFNMWLKVNGEEQPRQYGCPGNMIFSIPEIISAVSHVHTLEPGDLIITGTPEGVGAVYPGDVIEAGITELGISINVPIVEAGSIE